MYVHVCVYVYKFAAVFFISTIEETGIGDPAGVTDCSQLCAACVCMSLPLRGC